MFIFRLLFGMIKLVFVIVLAILAVVLLPALFGVGAAFLAVDGVFFGLAAVVIVAAVVLALIRLIFHLAFHTILTVAGCIFLTVGIGFHPLIAVAVICFIIGWIARSSSGQNVTN